MPHRNQRWFKHQSDNHGGLLKWSQQIPCVLSLQRLVIRSSLHWSFLCFSWYSIKISTYFNSWSMKYVFVVKIQIMSHYIQPWWLCVLRRQTCIQLKFAPLHTVDRIPLVDVYKVKLWIKRSYEPAEDVIGALYVFMQVERLCVLQRCSSAAFRWANGNL